MPVVNKYTWTVVDMKQRPCRRSAKERRTRTVEDTTRFFPNSCEGRGFRARAEIASRISSARFAASQMNTLHVRLKHELYSAAVGRSKNPTFDRISQVYDTSLPELRRYVARRPNSPNLLGIRVNSHVTLGRKFVMHTDPSTATTHGNEGAGDQHIG